MKLFDTSLLPGKAELIMDKAGQPVPYFCEELHRLALDRTLHQNDFFVVNPYNGILCAAARSDGCKVKAAMPSGDCWHSFCSGRAAVLDIPAILFSADLVCTCASENACSDVPSDNTGAGD
jgi:hypothetical protein